MTTPATNYTGYSIICDAMSDAKLLSSGDSPDSEMVARYLRKLNNGVNYFQTQGIKLFLLSDYALALVAGTNLYTLGPTGTVAMTKPTQVYDQYYLYSAANGANRRPVGRLARKDWDALSTASQQGPITSIFVDPQQNTLNINTWLTPDANEASGTLHLVLRNQVQNFVGVTDVMNFPIEWALALEWWLANEISGGQPPLVQQKCAQMAALYEEALLNWDTEQDTSLVLQPSQQMLAPSRFGK